MHSTHMIHVNLLIKDTFLSLLRTVENILTISFKITVIIYQVYLERI